MALTPQELEQWKNISSQFTEELAEDWQRNQFNRDQTREWINIGLNVNDANFCAWLRSKKGMTAEQALNQGNLPNLKNEYQNSLIIMPSGGTFEDMELIYDDEEDDEELKEISEQAREHLINFLKDWQEQAHDTIYQIGTTNTPSEWSKNPDHREEVKQTTNIYNILLNATKTPAKQPKTFKEILTRLQQWSNNEAYEIKHTERLIKEWEEAKEQEYLDKKADRYQAIDNIKNAIRDNLGAWHLKLSDLLPKDREEQITQFKGDLIAWEKAFINKLGEVLEGAREQLDKEEDEEEKKKIKNAIRAFNEIKNRTEQATQNEKLATHKKLMDAVKKTFERLDNKEVDANDDQHPYNIGLSLFKKWEELIIGDKKPSEAQEHAKKYIKLIEVALRNDNLANYRAFLEKVEEIDSNEQAIQPFKTCPQGFNCDYHTEGNWLGAWDKLLKELKALDAAKEKEKKEKDEAPCPCLHCSHGLGQWTWKLCPYYETSINSEKEKMPDIGGADGDHWTPPDGWTPFYTATGVPNRVKIANQTAKMAQLGFNWNWTHPYEKKEPSEEELAREVAKAQERAEKERQTNEARYQREREREAERKTELKRKENERIEKAQELANQQAYLKKQQEILEAQKLADKAERERIRKEAEAAEAAERAKAEAERKEEERKLKEKLEQDKAQQKIINEFAKKRAELEQQAVKAAQERARQLQQSQQARKETEKGTKSWQDFYNWLQNGEGRRRYPQTAGYYSAFLNPIGNYSTSNVCLASYLNYDNYNVGRPTVRDYDDTHQIEYIMPPGISVFNHMSKNVPGEPSIGTILNEYRKSKGINIPYKDGYY